MCVHVCDMHSPPHLITPDPNTSKLYGFDGDEVMLPRTFLILVEQRRPLPTPTHPAPPRTSLDSPASERLPGVGIDRSLIIFNGTKEHHWLW